MNKINLLTAVLASSFLLGSTRVMAAPADCSQSELIKYAVIEKVNRINHAVDAAVVKDGIQFKLTTKSGLKDEWLVTATVQDGCQVEVQVNTKAGTCEPIPNEVFGGSENAGNCG